MELFHQTVSMKSVGNLTDFVRSHMLEPFDVAPRVKALIAHYEDLNRAHEAVLKAKRQIEMLSPLVRDCDRHTVLASQIDGMRQCRESLRFYFASLKLALLQKRLTGLIEDLDRQEALVLRVEERRDTLRNARSELERNISDNGGDRLQRLESEIARIGQELEQRRKKAERYSELVRRLGESPAVEEPRFLEQRRHFAELSEAALTEEADLQNQITEHGVSLRQGKQEHDELCAEITSLKARQNNIRPEQITIRCNLCRALNLREQDMPFAGELLQVREEERFVALRVSIPCPHASRWFSRTTQKPGHFLNVQSRGGVLLFQGRHETPQQRQRGTAASARRAHCRGRAPTGTPPFRRPQ